MEKDEISTEVLGTNKPEEISTEVLGTTDTVSSEAST